MAKTNDLVDVLHQVDENGEEVSPKAIAVALRNLVYFDQLFREDLTGNDSGNNSTHISNRVKNDNEKYGTKLPTGRQQLINVKKMFISLGAVFREKGNDEPGEGSCYEYADRTAPLLWLSDAVGEIRKDLKKNVLKAKAKKLEAKQPTASEPHDVWRKLYIKQLMGLNSANDADYVDFYENMNLVGLEHFGELLEYVVDKKPVEISYVPFNGNPQCKKVYPYFLKNYNQRWFLLGRTFNETPNEKHPLPYYEKLSCYALDRIKALITDDGMVQVPAIKPWLGVEWVDCDVDIKEHYANMIGTTDTGDVQETILRFYKNEKGIDRYDYVKTKKMLPNQQEIQPGEKYYDPEHHTIRLQAMQNRELVQQVLSFGDDIEVIKPESLRNEVKEKISKMLGRYEV